MSVVMAVETRAQGRPPRGDGEVGRSKLLERTRNALKCKPKIDIQRREIAIIAGVTPALVSYYYPDKWDLLAAAAQPVIADYIADTRAILHRCAPERTKLLSLVHLFIAFNFYQGHLLDFYLENTEKMARKVDLEDMHRIEGEMLTFFEGLVRDGLVRGRDPAFIRASLWGWCKHVAQQPQLAPLAESPETEGALWAMAEDVCDMFLNGAATPQFAVEVDIGPRRHALTAG